jgi:aryl-alcohol dehydrogenase-like predicted oxidoreductase
LTDAQRALQFARSAPGVTVTLAGMSRASHVEENLCLRTFAPMAPAEFSAVFES